MIIIGSDHAGYKLKELIKGYLSEIGENYKDLGTSSEESCDYPVFAGKVAKEVVSTGNAKGILVCGSGIGVSIAANKVKGIRAALCMSSELAEMSRRHNDANILCLGARYIDFEAAKSIIKIFLSTEFEGGRHERRVQEIKDIEENN
ncbi:MAG: ribose 5-phosphate isomerase B [Clostridia bacterium]|nr:ribose 5-phosphate isomerase B [Clostridia bacterium]